MHATKAGNHIRFFNERAVGASCGRNLFGTANACYCASKLKQAMMAFLMGEASGWLVLRMVRMVRI